MRIHAFQIQMWLWPERGEQDQAVCAIPAWGSLVPGMGTGKGTTMSVVICVAGLVCVYT